MKEHSFINDLSTLSGQSAVLNGGGNDRKQKSEREGRRERERKKVKGGGILA